MANITTCSRCGGLYEAGSEEQANEPGRLCLTCFAAAEFDDDDASALICDPMACKHEPVTDYGVGDVMWCPICGSISPKTTPGTERKWIAPRQ